VGGYAVTTSTKVLRHSQNKEDSALIEAGDWVTAIDGKPLQDLAQFEDIKVLDTVTVCVLARAFRYSSVNCVLLLQTKLEIGQTVRFTLMKLARAAPVNNAAAAAASQPAKKDNKKDDKKPAEVRTFYASLVAESS
jgi:hypothetical protein